MTNSNNPTGAKLIGALTSAPFNALINEYMITSSNATDLFLGDIVKTNNTSLNKLPVVVPAAAGEEARGFIISIEVDEDVDEFNYLLAGIERKVYVCDDPNILLEIQVDGVLEETDIGKNADFVIASGNEITGFSGTQLDASSITTGIAQLKILKLINRKENTLGLHAKALCMFVKHELKASGDGYQPLQPIIITVPADFPTEEEADVDLNQEYIAAALVTDSDPTKTFTGQTLKKGDKAQWDGSQYLITDTIFWVDDGTDLTPVNAGRHINAGTGGFKDNDVTTAIALGEAGDVTFDTTKQSILGAVNEIYNGFVKKTEKTYRISPVGGDYTTIQAALTANTAGNELFLVYPGTYAGDTINFTANNQCVVGIGLPEQQIVPGTTTIIDFGAFTGCFIENIKMVMTVTTKLDMIIGSGSALIKQSHLEVQVPSGSMTAVHPTIGSITGSFDLLNCNIVYNNDALATGLSIKTAFFVGASAILTLIETNVDIQASGAIPLVTTLAYGTSSGTIFINDCIINVLDNDASYAVGYANFTGTGNNEIMNTRMTVTNNTGIADGLFLTSSSALTFRTMYNHSEIISSGGTSVYSDIGTNVTHISSFDTIVASLENTGAGNYIYNNSATEEPSGFPVDASTGEVNRGDSELIWSNGSLQLTIQPKAPATQFTVYVKGKKVVISSALTKVITDTQGSWFFYINDAGVLQGTQSFDIDFIYSEGIVAFGYWDAVNNRMLFDNVGDERHGCKWDGHSHAAWHQTIGARYVSGLALSGFTIGDGSLNTHAQFGSELGVIYDEDLRFDIAAIASTVGMDILYHDASGNWVQTTNAGYSVLTTGTGRLAYNPSGSALVEVTNNQFVLSHVFSTSGIDVNGRLAIIIGQDTYTNINQAREGALTEINNLIIAGLPAQEFKFIGTVIFQTADGYANAVKGRVRLTDAGENYVDLRNTSFSPSGGAVSSHANLSELGFDASGHGVGETGFQRGATNANVAPTVNDDDTAFGLTGYRPGNTWVDESTDTSYICVDATTGAAIWHTIDTSVDFNAKTDVFVSTLAQTSFVLSETPSGIEAVAFYRAGLVTTTYTLAGDTLTWTGPSLPAGQTMVAKYDYTAPDIHTLDQEQVYYFGDAGLDTNNGLSIEKPFLTITQAISAATAQTPSSSNQFMLYGIGDIEITPDFTLPLYVDLYAPGARLTANVTVNDNAVITVKDSLEPTTGSPPRNFSKTSGSGTATVNILGLFACGDGRGMNCTSGTLIVNTMNGTHGDGYLMGDGGGISILRSHGLITSAGSGIVAHANGGGKYDLHHTRIKSTSSAAVFSSGSSGGVLKAMGGWIDATGGGRLYQFGTASQFTLMGTGYDETNASTNIGASTLIFNIARDPSNNSIITNSIGVVDVNGTTF